MSDQKYYLQTARTLAHLHERDSGFDGISLPYKTERDKQIADRIAACLSACAGIEDPVSALKELIETLKVVRHARSCNAPWGQTEKYPTKSALDALLAKLGQSR